MDCSATRFIKSRLLGSFLYAMAGVSLCLVALAQEESATQSAVLWQGDLQQGGLIRARAPVGSQVQLDDQALLIDSELSIIHI